MVWNTKVGRFGIACDSPLRPRATFRQSANDVRHVRTGRGPSCPSCGRDVYQHSDRYRPVACHRLNVAAQFSMNVRGASWCFTHYQNRGESAQAICKAERMPTRKRFQDHCAAHACARRRMLESPGSVRERDSSADTKWSTCPGST